MQEIPSVFWMVIISVVTIFFCFVLYHLAMLLKESKNTVIGLQKTVNDINGITSELSGIVSSIKTPVDQIVGVVQRVSSVFSVASGIIDGFKSREE
jgi:uncharacterized protein YoxC